MKTLRLAHTSVVLSLLTVAAAQAHSPPTDAELEELRRTGKLAASMAFVEQLENDRFSEHVAARSHVKMMRAQLKAQGYSDNQIDVLAPQPAPPPDWRGLPTTGQPRSLTILVDFNDYRAAVEHPQISAADVAANIYGDGTPAGQSHRPYDSASAYWKRASQNALEIKGSALGWHSLPGNRASYEPAADDNTSRNQANFNLVKAVLQHYDATHDFAQYDNNNDGFIDGVNVIWTGPTGAWASFWWGYQWRFFVNDANNVTFDGKKLTWFTWQKLEPRDNNTDYDPQTLIHETGHLIGLPDLYDYKPDQGNQGGVGGFDIMDGNAGNPNGFLRWMMDWITPEVVSAGSISQRTLRASGDMSSNTNKAVVIFPGATNNYFREFFLIENRHRTGNDGGESNLPSDGLAIWHVDSTLNPDGNNFAFSNTDSPTITAHKLVRLVQADGMGQIEAATGRLDAGDFYTSGKTFTPTSTPPSNRYNGAAITVPTNVSVANISASGVIMTADIGFAGTTQQPDLADAGANLHGLSPSSRPPGQTFNVTGSVRNGGTGAAGAFRVAYYVSTNAAIEISDTLLGTRDIGALAAGATVSINTTLTVPAALGLGTYSVGWIIDSLGAVGESNEQNNSVSIATPKLTVTGANMPEFRLLGSGFDINDGDATPLADNGTEFGSTAVNAEVQRSFSLQNPGTGSLTVGAVTFGGTGASQFRVVTAPGATVAAGAATPLVLGFRPTSGGLKPATVQIVNSDNDENPFNFSIQGTGLGADDHGGTTATATVAGTPSTTAGSIENSGDEDYFRINIPSTGLLRVFSTGATDTFGYLLNAGGDPVLADDDSGVDRNFSLELQVTAATYYVKVTGYDATVTGAYALQVEFSAGASGDDHGNTRAAATVLAPGASISSSLEQGGDLDYFRIVLTQPGNLYVWTTGLTDTFAVMEDNAGVAFAQDDDSGTNRNCSLALALNPGTYYFRLSGYGPDSVGAYTINSSFVAVAPQDDHGNAPGTATVVLNNSETAGVINSGTDWDYFLLYVPFDGWITAFTTGQTDTFGQLETLFGFAILTTDDEGPGRNFGFLTQVQAGYYLLRVTGFDNTVTGPYQLVTTYTPGNPSDDHLDYPRDDQGSLAELNPASGTLPGTIEAFGDQDYFVLNLASAGLFVVETTGTTDTFGILRDEDGGTLATSDDDGTSGNFKMARQLLPGTYFVEVFGFEFSATGAYTLQWNFTSGQQPDDHGNNTAGATAVARNSSTAGTIHVGGDEDFFRFALTENSSVTLFTTGASDTFGHLLNSAGAELTFDDDAGDETNFRMVTVLPAGTYFVRVRGYDEDVTGEYSLHIGSVAAPVSGSFRITGAARAANGLSLNLTWTSQPGTVYRVETTLNATTGPWVVAAANITGAAGATTSSTVPLTPAEKSRFFRIVSQ